MKIIVFLFFAFNLLSVAYAQKLFGVKDPCFTFDSVITIKGKIRSVRFPDPNFETRTANEWVVRLESPICVIGEDTAQNVIDVQLEHYLWFNKTLRRKIDKLMRAHKLVTITGAIHYQVVGYDFLPVIMDVTEIK